MKNLTTLFLLFIVLISLAPCSDDLECDDVLGVTSYQITHRDEPPLENCTSICICACCGQRSMVVPQAQFEIEANMLSIKNTIRPHSFSIAKLAQNIWQPPKIA